MHFYPFNIKDWALHTAHLSLEEEGAYRRLLDMYYDTEQPIPKETQSVIRRLRLGSYFSEVEQVLSEFFDLEDDGYHNARADIEIHDYQNRVSSARKNGKKGGRPRKDKGLKTQSVNSANPAITEPKANQELEPVTRTSNQVVTKDIVDAKHQRAKVNYSPDDLASAEYMFSTLSAKQPEMKKPNLENWAGEIRKMREIDNLDINQMGEVWTWARNDGFWASNILSAKKFREKYQQLLATMRKPKSSGYQTTNEKNAARMAEIRDPQIAGNW